MLHKSDFFKKGCYLATLLLMHAYSTYASPYCTPANGSTFASSGGVNLITWLSVGHTGLQNTSYFTDTSGYWEYPSWWGNPVFRQSSTYIFSADVSNAAEVKAWIDYNHDSTFQNSEEIRFSISKYNIASGMVTIPAAALTGATRLRIMAAAASHTIKGPCGDMGSGEAEDYTIDITGPSTCPKPAGLLATHTTGRSGRIRWTGPPGAYFECAYDTSAVYSINTNHVNALGDSANLSWLSPGTKYYFFVRSVCGNNEFSDWAIDSFTTLYCNRPAKITVSDITDTSALVSWDTVGDAFNYLYNFTLSPLPPPVSIVVSGSSIRLRSLRPNKKYCFFVRAYCNNAEESEWTKECFTTWKLSAETVNGNFTSCYPNPVSSQMNVSLHSDAELILTDIAGRTLLRMQSRDKKATVDMRGLTDGIYFLKCLNGEQPAAIRVVKQTN